MRHTQVNDALYSRTDSILKNSFLLGPGPRLMKIEFTGPRSHKG